MRLARRECFTLPVAVVAALFVSFRPDALAELVGTEDVEGSVDMEGVAGVIGAEGAMLDGDAPFTAPPAVPVAGAMPPFIVPLAVPLTPPLEPWTAPPSCAAAGCAANAMPEQRSAVIRPVLRLDFII